MTTTAIFVWLGWGLAGLGALVTAWALFRDRSRGRKRCPKCWYDMAGVAAFPAACSECGRVVRHERALRGTRRRWVVAAVGVVMASSAWFVGHAPEIRQRGWIAAVPTEALVRIAPTPSLWWYPEQKPDDLLREELFRRIAARRVSDRQLAILLTRFSASEPDFRLTAQMRDDGTRADVELLIPIWTLRASQCDMVRVFGPGGDEALPDPARDRTLACGNTPVIRGDGVIDLNADAEQPMAHIEYIRRIPWGSAGRRYEAFHAIWVPSRPPTPPEDRTEVVVWRHEIPIEFLRRPRQP
jgi:hypothetical protein